MTATCTHRPGTNTSPSSAVLDQDFGPNPLAGGLVGVAVADLLDDGLSAIYTFYDPELGDRGLGTFAVLWQIEQTRELGLDYLYLGYWIKQCQKMAYKIQFRPLELYVNGNWVELL